MQLIKHIRYACGHTWPPVPAGEETMVAIWDCDCRRCDKETFDLRMAADFAHALKLIVLPEEMWQSMTRATRRVVSPMKTLFLIIACCAVVALAHAGILLIADLDTAVKHADQAITDTRSQVATTLDGVNDVLLETKLAA